MNTLVDFDALALDRLAIATLGEVLGLGRVWGHGQRFSIWTLFQFVGQIRDPWNWKIVPVW